MDPLREAVTETIESHPMEVRRWLANEPGAWGFLAAEGVLAYRRRLGRRLDGAERRLIWASLWAELERLRL
jgi:hypothetical protein